MESTSHARIQWQVGAFLVRTRQGRDGELLTISPSKASLAARQTTPQRPRTVSLGLKARY